MVRQAASQGAQETQRLPGTEVGRLERQVTDQRDEQEPPEGFQAKLWVSGLLHTGGTWRVLIAWAVMAK